MRLRDVLNSESVDELIRTDLQWVLESLRKDYEKRLTDHDAMAIFERDRHDDLAELHKHISAFEIVLRYYGTQDP